jgi:transcriptional regulator with XRE-family HTH domain
MELGQRIKDCRTEKEMTQEELAGRIYVSRQTISSWENDKSYPDVYSLLMMSDLFGVSLDTLIKVFRLNVK